jgi:hypothetical protein
MDLNQLPENERQHMMKLIEDKQVYLNYYIKGVILKFAAARFRQNNSCPFIPK